MANQMSAQEFLAAVRQNDTLRKELAERAGAGKADLAGWLVSLAAERGLVFSPAEVEASLREAIELGDEELAKAAGGRITNIRANVSGLGGGGLIGTTQTTK